MSCRGSLRTEVVTPCCCLGLGEMRCDCVVCSLRSSCAKVVGILLRFYHQLIYLVDLGATSKYWESRNENLSCSRQYVVRDCGLTKCRFGVSDVTDCAGIAATNRVKVGHGAHMNNETSDRHRMLYTEIWCLIAGFQNIAWRLYIS